MSCTSTILLRGRFAFFRHCGLLSCVNWSRKKLPESLPKSTPSTARIASRPNRIAAGVRHLMVDIHRVCNRI